MSRITDSRFHPGTIATLKAARARLIKDGFMRGLYKMDDKGNRLEIHEGDPWLFVDAIRVDALNGVGNGVASWDAQRALRKSLGVPDLWAWAAHPYRDLADCILAIDRARLMLGDSTASPREKSARRGGWAVAS